MSTTTFDAPRVNRPMTGTALVLASTIAWSFSGLFSRLLTTDPMTAVAFRSLFGGLFLLVPFLVLNWQRPVRALFVGGWPAVFLTVAQSVCQACTVAAFFYTTIANVAVIYATAPFMAAGLAYLLLRERMQPRTIFASVVSFAGVVIIVSSAFGHGNLFGDVLALVMTATFAVIIVIARAYPDARMLPSTIVSAVITFACFVPFSHPLATGAANYEVLAAFGFTNFTLAMFLFLAGSRQIAAAQAALIGTLDAVLSPFWVWVAFDEIPSSATFIGGGMIFAVVVWHTIREWQVGQAPALA